MFIIFYIAALINVCAKSVFSRYSHRLEIENSTHFRLFIFDPRPVNLTLGRKMQAPYQCFEPLRTKAYET